MLKTEFKDRYENNRLLHSILNQILNRIEPHLSYHEENKSENIGAQNIRELVKELTQSINANSGQEQARRKFNTYLLEMYELLKDLAIDPSLEAIQELPIDVFKTRIQEFRETCKKLLVDPQFSAKILLQFEEIALKFGNVAFLYYGFVQGLLFQNATLVSHEVDVAIIFELPNAETISLSQASAITEFVEALFFFIMRDFAKEASFDFDTGSPKFEILSRFNPKNFNVDIKMNLGETVEKILHALDGSKTNVAIREATRFLRTLEQYKASAEKDLAKAAKVVNDDDFYKNEHRALYDKYKKLKDWGLMVLVAKISEDSPKMIKTTIKGLLEESDD